MPFKSKAQQRFMFAAEARGEVPKGTAKRWAAKTPKIKKLPAKVRKKSAAEIAETVILKVAAISTEDIVRDLYARGYGRLADRYLAEIGS